MMPAPHDLDPDAMTDAERREKRRMDAGFAFETMPCPHQWRYSDSRDAFICTSCYEIDEAL